LMCCVHTLHNGMETTVFSTPVGGLCEVVPAAAIWDLGSLGGVAVGAAGILALGTMEDVLAHHTRSAQCPSCWARLVDPASELDGEGHIKGRAKFGVEAVDVNDVEPLGVISGVGDGPLHDTAIPNNFKDLDIVVCAQEKQAASQ
jgi:hypothetical protein